jgi:DNA-binding transcriptional regulator YiaG
MHSIPASPLPIQSIKLPKMATFAVISALAMGTGSVYELNRTGVWRQHIQPRVTPFILDVTVTTVVTPERLDVRTAAEHIENIRNVLNPAVSDLALVFDVSRQAIYKWVAGTSTPEDEKLGRIQALSKIADLFQNAGISRADSMLKMKTFDGRSLMDLIKAGENRLEHIQALIVEARVMESSYKRSGLATTKSKATDDWQSSISIPGSSELA